MSVGDVEVVVRSAAELGEGPLWDSRGARLFWLDVQAGVIHSYRPASATVDSIRTKSAIASLALGPPGKLVVAFQARGPVH